MNLEKRREQNRVKQAERILSIKAGCFRLSDKGERAREAMVDSGTTKLTMEKAREIRRRVAAGEARKDLAYEYGVSIQTIGFCVRGWSWIEKTK